MEGAPRGLGRCRAAFWLALAFDAAGFTALLAGVFADVFFADLLIYGGGVGVFLSLLWWVFWYVGNLEVPPAELQDDVGLQRRDRRPGKARGGGGGGGAGAAAAGLVGLVRSLSARFSDPFALPGASAVARSRGRSAKAAAVSDTESSDDRTASASALEQEREGGGCPAGRHDLLPSALLRQAL